jgi:hypothetical protein
MTPNAIQRAGRILRSPERAAVQVRLQSAEPLLRTPCTEQAHEQEKGYLRAARTRRGSGKQKAGVQDPKLNTALEAREADGTSRYAARARADASALSHTDLDEDEP